MVISEEENLWVVKDSNNMFVNKNSIKQIGKNKLAYVAFKTFSPECRGYISKQGCEEAIQELNKKSKLMDIHITFHMANLSLSELRNEHKKFSGNNMVYIEKRVKPLIKVI